MRQAVLEALQKELKSIRAKLAADQKLIDGFTAPFPKEEDYRDKAAFLKAYLQHVHNHTEGKYGKGKMEKAWGRKAELQGRQTELINAIWLEERH